MMNPFSDKFVHPLGRELTNRLSRIASRFRDGEAFCTAIAI